MNIEHHRFGFDIRAAFPDAELLMSWEGGAAYTASRAGKPLLIQDEGTLADFLGPEDEDLLDELVKVIEFEDVAERDTYVKENLPDPRKVEGDW